MLYVTYDTNKLYYLYLYIIIFCTKYIYIYIYIIYNKYEYKWCKIIIPVFLIIFILKDLDELCSDKDFCNNK